jgi:hypothetical protein
LQLKAKVALDELPNDIQNHPLLREEDSAILHCFRRPM